MATSARTAAAQALHGVFGTGRRVSEDWDAGLTPEDAGLAQAMLGLALRRWGRLQAWAAPRLKDPGRGLPLGSQVCLALGLVQLAWLDGVAAHAAVHEAVDLVGDRALGFPPHRGLLNALLRKAAADRQGLARELEAMPARLDRTAFVEEVLEAAAGPAPERQEALWARLQVPPRPAFRRLRGEPPAGMAADPGLPGCCRLEAGAAFPHDWLARGEGLVQDRSSQALMDFRWSGQPARILDACAAPGGKTAALALKYPAAQVTALEREPRRIRRLRDNLASWQLPAEVIQAEAAAWLEAGGPAFDLILLDAPCTGSGTLGKHPELGWLGNRLERRHLLAQQERLLGSAQRRLAAGGLLIYSVCSWLPEEGEAHRETLLRSLPELRPVEIWGEGLGGSRFRPDPLAWEGEGFQGFAVGRP